MWSTGSAFDGESFRLSDPSLYRFLNDDNEPVTELYLGEPPAVRRKPSRGRYPRRATESDIEEERQWRGIYRS